MAQYPVGPLHFEAESFGDPSRPAVVLVMGLGMQLIAWPMELVQALVDAGYRVVRFDNRDVGLSSKIDDAPKVNLLAEAARYFLRLPLKSAYTIRTRADDLAGLLDAMGIDKAHLAGASMGGMISQAFAAHYPGRALSLASIMSSSGARSLPTARWRVLKLLLAPPPRRASFGQLVQVTVRLFRALGGPGFPISDAELAERCGRAIERSYCPAGTARQMLAIAASGDRSDELRRIAAPTLVLHGDADPLLPLPHGRDCAAKIAGSRLVVVPGMGHDLPPALVPVLRDALVAHLRQTGG
jgi:pimeloyl-ACP methyl ester carboxylesterase